MADELDQAAPIAVYGSTGYTGRLVAHELRRRGLAIVLSGRSEQKLEDTAAAVGGEVEVKPARVDDPGSLRDLLKGCAAVINCAGPFSSIGGPVVAAAVSAGAHYVDTTGEQVFIKQVFDAYDTGAHQAGVAVVPTMGFDYVPGDMLARLVGDGLEPLDDLTLAYAVRAMRATRGTMLSGIEIARGRYLAYSDGDWRPAPRRLRSEQFDFPEPVGRQVVVPFPSGEIVTVPRHTRTRRVTSLITASTLAPKPLAPALPVLTSALSLATRTPAGALVRKLIEQLPEGPTTEQRTRTTFTVVARATAARRRRQAVLRGADVYGLTAAIAVEGAARMATGAYDRKGVLSPAQAFDPKPFLDRLAEFGVSYEVEPPP